MCPKGTLPDAVKEKCVDIPEVYLQADSWWAIGAMTFGLVGICITTFVIGIFLRWFQSPKWKLRIFELHKLLLFQEQQYSGCSGVGAWAELRSPRRHTHVLLRNFPVGSETQRLCLRTAEVSAHGAKLIKLANFTIDASSHSGSSY